MKVASILFFLLIITAFSAHYVQNQPFEHTQPDGKVLTLYVTGDEYYRQVHDEKGYTIVLHPETGYAVYAVQDGNSIIWSNWVAGESDPAARGITPNLSKDFSSAKALRDEVQRSRDAGNRGSPTGTFNNIMAFVRFSGQGNFPSTPTYATYYNSFMSTSQQSLADYYDEVSNGQLDINSYLYPAAGTGGVVLSYQLSHIRGYYSPYNATTNPTGYSNATEAQNRRRAMVTEIINFLNPDVPDGLDTDTDNDGIIDGLMILFRGSPDNWGDLLWPAHWSGSYVCGSINSADVTHYIFEFEGTSPPTGVSVLCHEMGHNIGFPDFYHYTSNGITPVGQWDLMASDNAQHSLTYNKMRYGTWFSSIPTITPTSTPTTYTLTAIEQSPYACYKINSTLANQYYVVEYRKSMGRYETGIPGSGLIVYRVMDTLGATDIVGNADGPPDEVYVYRINGTISVNGTINSAHLSSTVNRTKIHTGANPIPWLYSNTGTQLDGNLVITDVGSNGENTITFVVRDSPPNIWDGSSSTDWHTAANWSLDHVPTSSEDVEIPSLILRYPVVSAAANCRSIVVSANASVTISTGTLTVATDYTTYGALIMDNASGVLDVNRDLFFDSGATTDISASANIYVQSDVEFRTGSNVNMAAGYLRFDGTGASYFRVYADATLNYFVSAKTSPNISGNSALSTNTLTINSHMYVYANSTFTHPYGGTTVLRGGLYVYTGATCNLSSGTISMEGNTNRSLYLQESTASLNNLVINKTTGYTVTLSYPLTLQGSLTISNGTLNAANLDITVGRNWTNSAGIANFTEGTGTVILNGTGTQTLSTETFYTLVLNKASGSMSIPTGSTVICTNYDWTAGAYTVSGGTFTVGDLVDVGIMGTITLIDGTINYTQDTSNFVDLRANLTISGGTFNVSGGNSTCWFSYIDLATLTMTAGVLDIRNQGIRIPSSYVFNDNISGGTIRTVGSFVVERADFNPTGGTIEFYGGSDCTWQNTAGSNVYRVFIDKTATRDDNALLPIRNARDMDMNRRESTRANSVSGSGPLDINSNFVLNAGTFVAPATINLAGGWYNYVGPIAFQEGTGTVIFDSANHQYVNYGENFYAININKSGGALRVNNAAAVVSCASYTWTAGAVDVLAGTFTALDLTQNGIYGNFYNNTGGVINLYQDASQFADINGMIYNYGGTYNIYGGSTSCYMAYSANGGITMDSGVIDFKDKGITIFSSPYTLTWNITGGTIRTVGWYNETRGSVIFAGGELELYGPAQAYVAMSATSSLYNLKINKASTRDVALTTPLDYSRERFPVPVSNIRANDVLQNSNLVITNNLTLSAGKLDNSGSNYNINISGNWVNNVGTTAFVPGTGTVTFNKIGTYQDISGTTIFYNVTDSHTGNELRFNGNTAITNTLSIGNIVTFYDGATLNIVNNPTAGKILAFYNNDTYNITSYTGGGDLRCWTGSYVIVGDVTQNGFYGNYTISGSHLELHQDVANWIDINGNMTITNNGIVDIYGGSIACYPGYNGNCVFTMSSGEFNVKNRGFYFYNNGFSCDMVVSGGIIRCNGGWNDTWGVFDPTGGVVEFTGSEDNVVMQNAAGWFWTLRVNKVVSRDADEPLFSIDRDGVRTPITRSGTLQIDTCTLKGGLNIQNATTVYLSGALNCSNGGPINIANGVFNTMNYNVISTGNIGISAGGRFQVDTGSILSLNNACTITVYNGGTLIVNGNSTLAATITRTSTGYYGLVVNSGGTIGGYYGIFEYMNANGIVLNPGSTVDTNYPFANCTFRLGASGGRLLTINNSQSFTIPNASFPANTWGGAYNVTKSVDSGIVYFANWSGAFGGPTYEQDSYDHVYWQGFGIPPIIDLNIQYIAATNRVQLSWTYPLAATSYRIYRSTTPNGTFTYYAQSATNSWSQVVPGPKYFYKVTAVVP